ncbi:MAG: ribonuclease PH [Verrucomicrobiota bacterium]
MPSPQKNAPRHDGRKPNQLRPIQYRTGIAPHAAGSVLAVCGRTQVICAASLEERVPRWKEAQGIPGGWVTAEYSMLPYSTHDRKVRDIMKGRLDGRSVEIQRLIGRSLRAVVDLEKLGPRTLCVDCDVLAADGGTRTTAISGTYVALKLAEKTLIDAGKINKSFLKAQVAAVSVGLVPGQDAPARPLLDLDYPEDAAAEVDMNVVMTSRNEFVEVQATGEEATFARGEMEALTDLAAKGIRQIFKLQRAVLTG